jgi:hypothetical protein
VTPRAPIATRVTLSRSERPNVQAAGEGATPVTLSRLLTDRPVIAAVYARPPDRRAEANRRDRPAARAGTNSGK